MYAKISTQSPNFTSSYLSLKRSLFSEIYLSLSLIYSSTIDSKPTGYFSGIGYGSNFLIIGQNFCLLNNLLF